MYLIVHDNYGDQGIDPICCASNLKIIEQELSRIKSKASENDSQYYSIIDIPYLKNNNE